MAKALNDKIVKSKVANNPQRLKTKQKWKAKDVKPKSSLNLDT